MKSSFKKILSLILALTLMLSFSFAAFALEFEEKDFFRISCTVNGDSQTQRGFCWYTLNDCETQIALFKEGIDVTNQLNLSSAVCEKWQGYYMHKIVVSSLEAGTEYSYKVGADGKWSDEGFFTTDDGDENVNAVIFADVQASSLENFLSGARTVKKAYQTAGDGLDFAVNLGDFTNDSNNEQWDYYAEAFDSLNMTSTLVPVAGNHDGLQKFHWFNNMFCLNTLESVQNLNGVNYSYDYGNAHFAVLNTNDMLTVSQSQLKWLKNDMNKSTADWKIVLMHKSPYTLGKDGKWPDAMYLQQSLTKVCDECDVDLVFSGHDHQYLRTKPLVNNEVNDDGTVYILCGTAGTKRYEIRKFAIDNFTKSEFIERMVSQKDGYYFSGTDFNAQLDSYKGSCFNTLNISGTTLEFNSYILDDNSDNVTLIDNFSLVKAANEDAPKYDGENTTDVLDYGTGAVETVFNLVYYVVTVWLPKVIKALPQILTSYFVDGVF